MFSPYLTSIIKTIPGQLHIWVKDGKYVLHIPDLDYTNENVNIYILCVETEKYLREKAAK